MKTNKILFTAMFLVLIMGLSSLTFFKKSHIVAIKVDMPDNVKAVIENKCFGCHNTESQSDKAKEKLLFDKIDELSKAKLISTLGDIEEVLDENKMPPEKFLEKKPEKKLTDDEKQTLKEWAVATSEKMME